MQKIKEKKLNQKLDAPPGDRVFAQRAICDCQKAHDPDLAGRAGRLT